MNSFIGPKLFASLLAAFALALGAVPAFAQEAPEQPTTPTEQQQAPQQQPDDTGGGTGGTGTDEGGDEGGATATQSGKPTQEETDQYNRYCNQKDAEPSHSDKKFCEEYEKKYGKGGATAAGKPTQEEIDRYNRYCRMKNAEPSHNDKKFCEDFKKKYPDYGKEPNAGTSTTPTDTNKNEDTKKDDEPDSGPLAFTGLDIWQLALIGVVLVAGGIGARRMLAHQG